MVVFDPLLEYGETFGETIGIQELMQRWNVNHRFITDLCFRGKLKPFKENAIGFVHSYFGKRAFVFQSEPSDDNPIVIEDIDNLPRYEVLPEDTIFYLTDIRKIEEQDPNAKKFQSKISAIDKHLQESIEPETKQTSKPEVKSWEIANPNVISNDLPLASTKLLCEGQ